MVIEILKSSEFKIISREPLILDAYHNGKRIGVTIETDVKPDFISQEQWDTIIQQQ